MGGQPDHNTAAGSRPPGPADIGSDVDDATAAFVAHRSLLFTVAYEILGSAVDAEDVLQETWLRWVRVDLVTVRDRRAYLVRITTRQALNRVRSNQRRRESHVGHWLPEPLLTTPDVAEDVVLAESVSTAMLMVLETLSATERAVFVLREVFDVGYDDIAESVGKTPAAVRQIAHRARNHVQSRRPRVEVSQHESRAAIASFKVAVETGNLQGLMDVLAPDAVLMADGGGKAKAVPKAITGADKLARLFFGGMRKAAGKLTAEPVVVNGSPALLVLLDGRIDGVLTVVVRDGLISELFYVRNPDKLSHVVSGEPRTLTS